MSTRIVGFWFALALSTSALAAPIQTFEVGIKPGTSTDQGTNAASQLVLADGYRFESIRVPGSAGTGARGINARGDIVGDYDDRAGTKHAFLLREGVFTRIDFPGAVSWTSAKGINARGDIVGDFYDATGVKHGFLLSDGQFSQIDHPPAEHTMAFYINNAGDISGRAYYVDGSEHGFLLKDGVFYGDRAFPSGVSSLFGVQDNGKVLLGDIGLEEGLFGFVGSRRHYEVIAYPGPEPVDFTAVRWINQRGDIVGVTGVGDGEWFGFLLRDGTYTRIDVPFSGATTTRPLAINDDGVIVGDYSNRRGRTRGFIAKPN